MLTTRGLVTVPIQCCYSIIENIPYTVHYISMANLFCNYKFISLNPSPLPYLALPPHFLLANTYSFSASKSVFIWGIFVVIFLLLLFLSSFLSSLCFSDYLYVTFGFLALFCVCIYYRFLICHKVHI